MKTDSNSGDLAEILKGGANHYRIDILRLLEKSDKLTLDEIAAEVGGNYKTISAHAARLQRSGLIIKRYKGAAVEHALTPNGKQILKLLKTLA